MAEENLEQILNRKREELYEKSKIDEERKEQTQIKEILDEEKARKKAEVRRRIYNRISRIHLPTGKILGVIAGISAVVGGIIYRDDIGKFVNKNILKNTTEIVEMGEIPRIVNDEYTVRRGTYDIDHSIVVKKNGKLTIPDSVMIYFKDSNDGISIKGGELKILGTKKFSVTLDAQQNNMNGTTIEYWDGITIKDSRKDNTIEYTTIRRVKDMNSGGGIHTINSNLTLNESNIEQCIVTGKEYGGGMLNDNSDIKMKGTIIQKNFGSGIYNRKSILKMEKSFLIKNITGSEGGGMHNEYSNVNIRSNTITLNEAKLGAGVYNSNSEFEMYTTKITGNVASKDGGGFYSEKSINTIVSSVITQNSAGRGGIKLYSSKNSIYKDSESKITLLGNNTIEDDNQETKTETPTNTIPTSSGKMSNISKPTQSTNIGNTAVQSGSTLETRIENTDTSVVPKPKSDIYNDDTITKDTKLEGANNAYPERRDNTGSTSLMSSLHRPELNHTYVINDSTFYCNNPAGSRNSGAFLFILIQANSPPIPKTISTERFDYLYRQGKVRDLGNIGRRDLIHQIQEMLKQERAMEMHRR